MTETVIACEHDLCVLYDTIDTAHVYIIEDRNERVTYDSYESLMNALEDLDIDIHSRQVNVCMEVCKCECLRLNQRIRHEITRVIPLSDEINSLMEKLHNQLAELEDRFKDCLAWEFMVRILDEGD